VSGQLICLWGHAFGDTNNTDAEGVKQEQAHVERGRPRRCTLPLHGGRTRRRPQPYWWPRWLARGGNNGGCRDGSLGGTPVVAAAAVMTSPRQLCRQHRQRWATVASAMMVEMAVRRRRPWFQRRQRRAATAAAVLVAAVARRRSPWPPCRRRRLRPPCWSPRPLQRRAATAAVLLVAAAACRRWQPRQPP